MIRTNWGERVEPAKHEVGLSANHNGHATLFDHADGALPVVGCQGVLHRFKDGYLPLKPSRRKRPLFWLP